MIRYYPGRYDTRLLGIFPVGDLTFYIPVEEVSFALPRSTFLSAAVTAAV